MRYSAVILAVLQFGLTSCANVSTGKNNTQRSEGAGGPADDDGDGFTADEDCDDFDRTSFPGADERCDGRDNDCDGDIDEPDAVDVRTYYADADGDGYGDPSVSDAACDPADGMVDNKLDCDDTDAAVNPETLWYRDRDGDGFGDPETAQQGCTGAEGAVLLSGDCDDRDPTAFPDAPEHCNLTDDDCDSIVDEDAIDALMWFRDSDGDGHGSASDSVAACSAPEGYVEGALDCDDALPEVNPEAPELCNGQDDNCDGVTDEDTAIDAATWYADTDGDGFGSSGATATACSQPTAMVDDDTDCDDSDAAINPAATEHCDGHDNDCDGVTDEDDAADAATWYEDGDGDGYGSSVSGSRSSCSQPTGFVADDSDCDDTSAHIYPSAPELCDGEDTDCDASTDEAGLVAFATSTSWQDVTSLFSSTESTPSTISVISDGTLYFCDGTYFGTLYLDADVSVTAGSGSPILDGADAGPVVVVDTGGVSATVSSIEITGGLGATSSAGSDEGGGVFCDANASLSLTDVLIESNQAVHGGGVRSDGCDLTLEGVEITSNTATYGGGLSIDNGDVEMIDCLIENNIATSWGGGLEIYTSSGPVTVDLDGTQVTGNTSGNLGGGLLLYESPYPASALCDGSRSTLAGIYDNDAAYGGGALVYSGTLTGTLCDMGTGGLDNSPDDVRSVNASTSYGNNETFSCTGTGCSP